jgi:predicted GNAT superfamily acetyltransferase
MPGRERPGGRMRSGAAPASRARPCAKLCRTMGLREATRADWPALLAVNAASVRELSPLDEQRLRYILALAHRSLVVERAGEVVGFAVAIAPGTEYDSRNYGWFGERYERFLYLDRIAVAAPLRR